MWTHVSLGLREDDMPAPSGDQPVRTGAQAAASGTWGRSSYARFRDRHGLGGFVRLRQEQGFERSQLTLTMQVDWPVSAASADGPDADLTHRLGLLATIMGYALLHGVLEHEARRAGIMGRLSAAQRQVLPHVLEGLSEREVAAKLRRSPHTVHDHVKAIYAALGIASRHQLRDLWNGMSSPAGTPEPEGGTGAERARTIGADES
ncbi:MAG: response regulator transcription factor [Phycisphaerae bacterium]|nr:response regulator transcription factor [Phycisphaerae bacterium]